MCKALTTAFVIAATLAVTSAQEPVAIGIVRIDGILMPITLITAKRFAVPPKTEQTFVNGVPIGPVPLAPPDWPLMGRVWTLGDGREAPIEITTVGKVMAPMAYCSDRLLWSTSLKRPPAPEGIAPIEKIGAAVSGAHLEFPENVAGLPDSNSRRVADRIAALFLTRQKARLAAAKDVSPAGTPAAARIKQLARHAVGGTSVYYFEAVNALRLSDGSIAPDAGLVTGWIVDSAAGLKDYDVTYKINDDLYKENDHAVIRGIVSYQGRALWLLEWHGWESEYYTLHDWPSGTLRLTVGAYEC